MKRILLLCILALATLQSRSQINSFPSTEGFESTFTTGLNVQFIPNWTGNDVQTSSRIFQDNVNFRSGSFALAAIPTSTYIAEMIVNLDLSGVSNMTMQIWAKSEVNGTGDRQAIVYASTSTDGGLTYGPATQIGDSTSFPNASTSYSSYTYAFSPNTNNQSNVRLKLTVSRGNGVTGGTAARFIMDDVTFAASAVDIFPPTVVSAVPLSTSSIEVTFSEAVNSTASNTANYTGIPGLSSASLNAGNDKATLNFGTPFSEGVFYTLTVAGIADLAGNVMTNPQAFNIVFNDNTGNVKITEIMYNNPAQSFDSLEFVEIRNLDSNPIAIGGWRFARGLTGVFPSGLTINPGEYKVFAHYPAKVDAFFGITSIGWDAVAALNNGGDSIVIVNASGVMIDSVSYLPTLPWDTLANGRGPSLTLCNESANNDDPASWTASLDSAGVLTDSTGTYIVYATPGGPCITVGLGESIVNEIPVSLYPVPAHNELNVKFRSEVYGRYEIKITDLSGRNLVYEVMQASAGENRLSLGIGKLATGVYILSLEGEYGSTQLRFIKD